MFNLKLGIIYKDGKIINHRSFIKVVFNPILRCFGYYIGSKSNKDLTNIIGMSIFKCDRCKLKYQKYNCEYDFIIKKRLFY